ncbi:MAG: hypothetical protein ACUVX8_05325 [Candidatus Zipacnadales bacterium]
MPERKVTHHRDDTERGLSAGTWAVILTFVAVMVGYVLAKQTWVTADFARWWLPILGVELAIYTITLFLPPTREKKFVYGAMRVFVGLLMRMVVAIINAALRLSEGNATFEDSLALFWGGHWPAAVGEIVCVAVAVYWFRYLAVQRTRPTPSAVTPITPQSLDREALLQQLMGEKKEEEERKTPQTAIRTTPAPTQPPLPLADKPSFSFPQKAPSVPGKEFPALQLQAVTPTEERAATRRATKPLKPPVESLDRPASPTVELPMATPPLTALTPKDFKTIRLPASVLIQALPPAVLSGTPDQVVQQLAEVELSFTWEEIAPQLAVGEIRVAALDVLSQLPPTTLAGRADQLVQQIPNGVILPLEELVMRIPPELFELPAQQEIEVPVASIAPIFHDQSTSEDTALTASPSTSPAASAVSIPDEPTTTVSPSVLSPSAETEVFVPPDEPPTGPPPLAEISLLPEVTGTEPRSAPEALPLIESEPPTDVEVTVPTPESEPEIETVIQPEIAAVTMPAATTDKEAEPTELHPTEDVIKAAVAALRRPLSKTSAADTMIISRTSEEELIAAPQEREVTSTETASETTDEEIVTEVAEGAEPLSTVEATEPSPEPTLGLESEPVAVETLSPTAEPLDSVIQAQVVEALKGLSVRRVQLLTQEGLSVVAVDGDNGPEWAMRLTQSALALAAHSGGGPLESLLAIGSRGTVFVGRCASENVYLAVRGEGVSAGQLNIAARNATKALESLTTSESLSLPPVSPADLDPQLTAIASTATAEDGRGFRTNSGLGLITFGIDPSKAALTATAALDTWQHTVAAQPGELERVVVVATFKTIGLARAGDINTLVVASFEPGINPGLVGAATQKLVRACSHTATVGGHPRNV